LKAGALSHVNAGEGNAPVCASCHNSGTKNLSEPYLTRFASSPAGSFTGTPPNCYNASMCHGDVRKTSNCDACHSTANTNPFKSMAGATATSDAKVGAHVKHLSAATQTTVYSANIACSECHAVPASPLSSGTHRNGANTITFGTLAKTGSLLPTYTPATGVCANTYCHGTTLTGGGSNKAPVWNQGDYLTAGCATCHGYPPTTVRNGAAAHASNSACSGCHSHVNATNNGFTTSGVILHINGTVEATGGGHAVPNYNHQSAGTGASCIVSGCHALGTATSVYPAASGAPDCRGCHKKASPGTGTGTAGSCSSCHGSATASAATAGRPTGTASAFPDKTGQHSRGDHNNVACTVCHVLGASAGTGATVNHGPGNRGTNPNVVGPAFTNGITLSGGTKGTSPAVSCDHNIVGGGCGSGEGVRTW
jgi:predicted CxxxxCH...CXXCH cytochrome family protein